eukprot:COSAG01_NODE_1885_length_8988_cov_2.861514_10_plen_132_part_00
MKPSETPLISAENRRSRETPRTVRQRRGAVMGSKTTENTRETGRAAAGVTCMTGARAGGAKGPHRSGAGVRLQLRLRDSTYMYSESMRTAFLLLLAPAKGNSTRQNSAWLLGSHETEGPSHSTLDTPPLRG